MNIINLIYYCSYYLLSYIMISIFLAYQLLALKVEVFTFYYYLMFASFFSMKVNLSHIFI